MNNIQVVQKVYECFGRGDIPGILELLADDVVFDDNAAFWIDGQPKLVPFSGRVEGKNNIPGFFQKMQETTEIKKFEPKKFFENGNDVIALCNLAGRFKTDGTEGENVWVMLWNIENGKVKNLHVTTMPGTV